MSKRIKDLNELKELAANDGGVEVFILLTGRLRSSKRLWYHEHDDTWDVYNEIDDSSQDGLSTKDLDKDTMVIEALNGGALYQYD
jgi:hypothetical protein